MLFYSRPCRLKTNHDFLFSSRALSRMLVYVPSAVSQNHIMLAVRRSSRQLFFSLLDEDFEEDYICDMPTLRSELCTNFLSCSFWHAGVVLW
jgi:hypothetical protein